MKIDLSAYKNSTVCVALSGGMDSMCLTDYMLKHAFEQNISVCVANVEHGIRGESSVADSAFVANYCKVNAVKLYAVRVDAPAYAKENGLGLEEAARVLRYAFFDEIVASGKADYIATAHHMSDSAETVLFNLFRGSSLSGVTGIKDRDKFIRPFVYCSKAEIFEYAEVNGIKYVTDETNKDEGYTRNYIRATVIPTITRVFPEAERAIARFSTLAKSDDEYLYSLAKRLVTVINDSAVGIDVNGEKPLFSRACIMAFKLLGTQKDYTEERVNDIFALREAENGSGIDLLNNLRAVREYDKVVLYKKQPFAYIEYIFGEGEFVFLNDVINVERLANNGKLNFTDGSLYIDADYAESLGSRIAIRNRREGDMFAKFGSGSKKLRDYLIDKKISQRVRDGLALVAVDSEILVVCGVEISEKAKVTNKTKWVYRISVQKHADK